MKNTNRIFSISTRLKSFNYAFQGLIVLLHEVNFIIHLIVTSIVIGAGWYFNIPSTEWIILLLTVGLVLLAEGLNTALEYLVDPASPDFHPLAKKSKDVAAAAVLITATIAGIVGIIIFSKYLF